jgi:anti-anti-sigma factor
MGYSQPPTRTAVVVLPAEIDAINARETGDDLLAAFVPGVTAVVADMTATTFCDSSAVHMLAHVRREAFVNLAELILVVPSAGVLRVLALTRMDTMLPIYATLAEVLSAESLPGAGATR